MTIDLWNFPIHVTDWETYYDDEFSLSKMKTVDYVIDPRFEPIGASAAANLDLTPEWLPQPSLGILIDHLRREQATGKLIMAAHNAKFDGTIWSLRYGIKPAISIDTMSALRTLGLATAGMSLSLGAMRDYLVAAYPNLTAVIPPKGHEVVDAKGKRFNQFLQRDLDNYGRYCRDDSIILQWLTKYALNNLPHEEFLWQTRVLKAYSEPNLRINRQVVEEELVRVENRRNEMRNRVMAAVGVADEVAFQKLINSNPKFAQLLIWCGVTPPMKFSTQTKKMTFAFSKKDDDFLALQDHPDEIVRLLVEARLGLKSSMEVSRCVAFIEESKRGFFPIPYTISGASSHRLGGCVVGDTMITCLQPDGSIVDKAIVDVLISDLVWDGEEFVEHEGVAYRGEREVITYDGITGTHCHPVFTDAGHEPIPLAEAARTGARIVDAATPPHRGPDTDRVGRTG